MVNQYRRTRPDAADDAQPEDALHVTVWNVTRRKTVDRDKRTADDAADEKKEEGGEDGGGGVGPGGELSALESDPAVVLKDSLVEDRELHRHFLRFADGSWIECLDGVEAYGGELYGKRELEWVEAQDKARKTGEDEALRRADEDDPDSRRRAAPTQPRLEEGRVLPPRAALTRASTLRLRQGSVREGEAAEKDAGKEKRSLRWDDAGEDDDDDSDNEEEKAAPTPTVVVTPSAEVKEEEDDAGDVGMLGSTMTRQRMPSLLTQTISEEDDENGEDEDD